MRAFFGLEIPDDVKSDLEKYILLCRDKQEAGIVYVTAVNLHITIKFLGDIDSIMIDSILKELKKDPLEPGAIEITGTGFFPDPYFPRIFRAGVEKKVNIDGVFNRLENVSLGLAKIPPDKNGFFPHITLARFKKTPEKKFMDFIRSGSKIQFGQSFVPERLVLYKSELKKYGPEYEAVNYINFGT